MKFPCEGGILNQARKMNEKRSCGARIAAGTCEIVKSKCWLGVLTDHEVLLLARGRARGTSWQGPVLTCSERLLGMGALQSPCQPLVTLTALAFTF